MPRLHPVSHGAIFSARWWTIVTKRDAFYQALVKHITPTTLSRRFKVNGSVEIRAYTGANKPPKPKKNEPNRGGSSSTLSPSVSAPMPSTVEEEDDNDFADSDHELAQEAEELRRESSDVQDDASPGNRPIRRAATAQKVQKFECSLCGNFDTLEKIRFDDGAVVCYKCSNANQTADTNVPPREEKAPNPATGLTAATRKAEDKNRIKLEEEGEVEVVTTGNATTTGGRKRSRQEAAPIVTINGQDYLAYVDANGKGILRKLEEHPGKKIKVEIEVGTKAEH